VRKLRGESNWLDWKTYMKGVLIAKKLWAPFVELPEQLHVSDLDNIIEAVDTNDIARQLKKQLNQLSGDELDKLKLGYADAAAQAWVLLYAALGDEICPLVRDVPSTKPGRLWQKLRSLYERETPESTRLLKAKFDMLRMKPDETVAQLETRINTDAQNLRARGVNISEQDVDLFCTDTPTQTGAATRTRGGQRRATSSRSQTDR
jgi:hypothetical protein